MVAMSDDVVGSGLGEPEEVNGVDEVDFDELGADIMANMERLVLVQSKSTNWQAILLPIKEMPGEKVEATLGAMGSGGPATFDVIRKSLDLMKLAVIESTETEGGTKLDELSLGEWLDLLDQWTSVG